MPKIVNDEEVFQAVVGVFIERGYAGATTKQLAKAAGVSEVTLFRKYGSKAELVRQAIAFIAEQVNFEAEIGYTGDVSVDLLRVVTRYREMTSQYGEFLAVMISELHRHPELTKALARPMGIMHSIAELILRYQQEGVLRSEPPLHGVAALLGPLIYFAMAQGELFTDAFPPIDLEGHVSHFLNGRLAGDETTP